MAINHSGPVYHDQKRTATCNIFKRLRVARPSSARRITPAPVLYGPLPLRSRTPDTTLYHPPIGSAPCSNHQVSSQMFCIFYFFPRAAIIELHRKCFFVSARGLQSSSLFAMFFFFSFPRAAIIKFYRHFYIFLLISQRDVYYETGECICLLCRLRVLLTMVLRNTNNSTQCQRFPRVMIRPGGRIRTYYKKNAGRVGVGSGGVGNITGRDGSSQSRVRRCWKYHGTGRLESGRVRRFSNMMGPGRVTLT